MAREVLVFGVASRLVSGERVFLTRDEVNARNLEAANQELGENARAERDSREKAARTERYTEDGLLNLLAANSTRIFGVAKTAEEIRADMEAGITL